MDPRIDKLAEVLLGFSIKLKHGEKILIDAHDVPDDIVLALIRSAQKRKALPFVITRNARILRETILASTPESMKLICDDELKRMKKMDAYVAIRGSQNIFEFSDIPSDKMTAYMKAMKPVLDWRVKKTRWVVLRWPTPSMAQQSLMSTKAFEDLYFKVCTLDYSRMIPGMKVLKKLMEKTDQVRLTGLGTDVSFSIKDIPAVMCGGQFNIPDGEVFTAPVKNSVEGQISYNVPSVYHGESFDNIRLEFKKGKIVGAYSSNHKRLNQILNSDKGARFIGEFAIGFNPFVTEPMRDILFDEKIAGSFHFTPGQAYKEADNGNRSQVHWDMVCIQRPKYGGGEIRFDGKLIRKDGKFIPRSLRKLNPDYLLKGKNG